MTRCRCPHEDEIAAALRTGRWPEGATDPVQLHLPQCALCAETVLIAQILRQERTQAVDIPSLPSPGALWWRAQLRRRYRDVERATRPIALVEKLSLVCLPLACVAFAVWNWRQIFLWLSWLAGAERINEAFAEVIQASASSSGVWIPVLLIAALATIALFGGLALYLLVERE